MRRHPTRTLGTFGTAQGSPPRLGRSAGTCSLSGLNAGSAPFWFAQVPVGIPDVAQPELVFANGLRLAEAWGGRGFNLPLVGRVGGCLAQGLLVVASTSSYVSYAPVAAAGESNASLTAPPVGSPARRRLFAL